MRKASAKSTTQPGKESLQQESQSSDVNVKDKHLRLTVEKTGKLSFAATG